jgi:histidinol-phosphate aminotransferase
VTARPRSGPRLREDLGTLEGYHSPQIQVPVRLNTNESPYPPPSDFVDAWRERLAATALHRYPDRAATTLRGALAAFVGHTYPRVFCANGSNEVLQTILLAYGGPGRQALVFEPSYVLHAHISRITGTGLVAGERNPDFRLDPGEATRLIASESPAVVFLTSPNNPTGMVEPQATVEALLEAVAARGDALLVVDEAYAEFAPWSPMGLVAEDLPLAVVRTYSKVWSMAALRLGFCVAPSWVVADLEKVVLPYHLSAATQLAGTLALAWRDEMAARVASIVSERERLTAGLTALDGVEVFPSGANFILFRPLSRAEDGHGVWEALLRRGVLVRDFSAWPRLAGCLRVTVGRPEENDAFLTALKEVLA